MQQEKNQRGMHTMGAWGIDKVKDSTHASSA
jgi:hypothetical protein